MVQLNLALKEKQKNLNLISLKYSFLTDTRHFASWRECLAKLSINMNIRHSYVVKLLDCVLQKIYGLTTKFINAK